MQPKGRRKWQVKPGRTGGVPEAAVRRGYRQSLLRRRGEWMERSIAHGYDTGMKRSHARPQNILEWQLIHLGAFNLSLMPAQLTGAGTRRE